MIAGFVTLVTLLLSILFWALKQHAARASDPLTQNANRYEQIDQDLVKRDSTAATLHATDDLNTLDRVQNHSAGH